MTKTNKVFENLNFNLRRKSSFNRLSRTILLNTFI